MAKVSKESIAYNPLILRINRLMEAFAKSDDERDFYLDKKEGFILFIDLDKSEEQLTLLEKEINANPDRYFMVPKLSFYETKKIMEGFVNEKVYDIDTKEKLLEIIQLKDARENFLEFIYDHHNELEKWQQFYQERSRIRIIEWLRSLSYNFVFEEDLDIPKIIIERIKENLFTEDAPKEVMTARKTLLSKAKTYYSNEALNPRPKRGRPPKQVAKLEVEPQVSNDIYTSVPSAARSFLFTPDISQPSASTFSSKFNSEEELLESRRIADSSNGNLGNLSEKLASLRSLSSSWLSQEKQQTSSTTIPQPQPETAQPAVATQPKKQTKTPEKKTTTKKKAVAKTKKEKKESSSRTLKKTTAKKTTVKRLRSLETKKTTAKKTKIKKKTAATSTKSKLITRSGKKRLKPLKKKKA